ncbi:tetratricopeptide repeat protein [Synechococcus sp. HIMB2401]|uniref:tetratricopeptide repeat protein n=1 Tax=Synechococcus sp. HIMB2401 TaxID=3144208 RepID=UPI0036F40D87
MRFKEFWHLVNRKEYKILAHNILEQEKELNCTKDSANTQAYKAKSLAKERISIYKSILGTSKEAINEFHTQALMKAREALKDMYSIDKKALRESLSLFSLTCEINPQDWFQQKFHSAYLKYLLGYYASAKKDFQQYCTKQDLDKRFLVKSQHYLDLLEITLNARKNNVWKCLAIAQETEGEETIRQYKDELNCIDNRDSSLDENSYFFDISSEKCLAQIKDSKTINLWNYASKNCELFRQNKFESTLDLVHPNQNFHLFNGDLFGLRFWSMMSLGQKKESLNYLQYLISTCDSVQNSWQFIFALSSVYARLGMTDKSNEEIDKLKAVHPRWEEYGDINTTHIRSSLSDNAEYQSNAYRMYELALKTEDLKLADGIACTLFKMNFFVLSASLFNKTINKLKTPFNLMGYAKSLASQGKYVEAVVPCKQLTKIDPNNYYSWLGLGAVSRRAGDLQTSLSAFKKVIYLAPESWTAYHGMGIAYDAFGNKKSAILSLEKAMNKCNNNQMYDQIDIRLKEIIN